MFYGGEVVVVDVEVELSVELDVDCVLAVLAVD